MVEEKVGSSVGLGPRVQERDHYEEQYLYERLADLRNSYELAAKPYIARLVQISSLRQAPSIMLTLDQAREFINFTMGPNVELSGHQRPKKD